MTNKLIGLRNAQAGLSIDDLLATKSGFLKSSLV